MMLTFGYQLQFYVTLDLARRSILVKNTVFGNN